MKLINNILTTLIVGTIFLPVQPMKRTRPDFEDSSSKKTKSEDNIIDTRLDSNCPFVMLKSKTETIFKIERGLVEQLLGLNEGILQYLEKNDTTTKIPLKYSDDVIKTLIDFLHNSKETEVHIKSYDEEKLQELKHCATFVGFQGLVSVCESALTVLEKSQEAADVPQKIILGDRPQKIQNYADDTFTGVMNDFGHWFCNGQYGFYSPCGYEEEKIFRTLASTQKSDTIYLIDVGCGQGCWGKEAMRFLLNDEVCRNSGKKFVIFSVTGGLECPETTIEKEHVTLHQFNQFKAENIDEEFLQKGFDLTGKAHLIVSKWTLRHLLDPWGTVKKMYNLLTPSQGMLMSTGFLFTTEARLESQFPVCAFPSGKWDILANTNAVSLFKENSGMKNSDDFLLMRTNEEKLEIPLEYTGNVHYIGDHWQCACQEVCVFKEVSLKKDYKKCRLADKNGGTCCYSMCYYCDENNQQSKDLYEELKKWW